MSDRPALLISEFNVLREALAHYEKHLEHISTMTNDEDEELRCDEKLQDILGARAWLHATATAQYGLDA